MKRMRHIAWIATALAPFLLVDAGEVAAQKPVAPVVSFPTVETPALFVPDLIGSHPVGWGSNPLHFEVNPWVRQAVGGYVGWTLGVISFGFLLGTTSLCIWDGSSDTCRKVALATAAGAGFMSAGFVEGYGHPHRGYPAFGKVLLGGAAGFGLAMAIGGDDPRDWNWAVSSSLQVGGALLGSLWASRSGG